MSPTIGLLRGRSLTIEISPGGLNQQHAPWDGSLAERDHFLELVAAVLPGAFPLLLGVTCDRDESQLC